MGGHFPVGNFPREPFSGGNFPGSNFAWGNFRGGGGAHFTGDIFPRTAYYDINFSYFKTNWLS